MARKESIVKYTDKALAELVKHEGAGFDWDRAAHVTRAEIEALVACDPDDADAFIDWGKAAPELAQPKAVLNMKIDRDILEYFRKKGKGYQTLINAVLRSYVNRKEHHPR